MTSECPIPDLDPNYNTDCLLMQSLRHTYPAFFQKFGRFTQIQRDAIPFIQKGDHALLVSGTATGKTEAACAPIIERNLLKTKPWTILYICPTRALVNDIYYRLYHPAQMLDISLKRRTGDHRDHLARIPNIIVTTPESFDSLLCRNRRNDPLGHDLAHVVAVVLDEIHLLNGTPRGDQIGYLLERLKKLREFSVGNKWSASSSFQIIGLSATIPNTDDVCNRYFPRSVKVVQSLKSRYIETVSPPSEGTGVRSALLTYIEKLEKDEKILVFSNSRKRVDLHAKHFKTVLEPLGYDVHAHHGSLSKGQREAAEFASHNSSKIVICATSTLEIGIDIGDIDLVVLDGPPPDVSSLLQRIGRGNRRTDITRVMACAESVADLLLQNAMIDAAREGWLGKGFHGPNYSVIPQQIASYIFQSPDRCRSYKSLNSLFSAKHIPNPVFDSILTHMIDQEQLAYTGDKRLKLEDYWLKKAETMGQIHSNIGSSGGMDVVDIDTGDAFAHDIRYGGGKSIGIGGKTLEVQRWENMTLEVRQAINNPDLKGKWDYITATQLSDASQAEALRRYLGIPDLCWPLVRSSDYLYAFHLGGSVRSAALNLLVQQYAEEEKSIRINGFYIRLPSKFNEKPVWCNNISQPVLRLLLNNDKILHKLEAALGRLKMNRDLPTSVRMEEAWEWLDFNYESDNIQRSKWEFLKDPLVTNALSHFIVE